MKTIYPQKQLSTADVEKMKEKRLKIYKEHLNSFYDTSDKQSQGPDKKVLTAEDFKPDMVNHPPHYNVNGFEVIDIIQAFTEDLTGIAAVDTANAIKYILRWHNKNGVEDLKKAKWYIDHLIKKLEEWEDDR